MPHWSHRSAPPTSDLLRSAPTSPTGLSFSDPRLAALALLCALTDPGDEVLFLSGGDPWLARLAPVVGARATHLRRSGETDERWVEKLWGALQSKTRAVVRGPLDGSLGGSLGGGDPHLDDELALLGETDVALVLDELTSPLGATAAVHATIERDGAEVRVRLGSAPGSDELARRLAHAASWLASPPAPSESRGRV